MKTNRQKIDDCYNCIYYREKCDGNNMYKPETSAWGVVRCKTQKENMTAKEIDEYIGE